MLHFSLKCSNVTEVESENGIGCSWATTCGLQVRAVGGLVKFLEKNRIGVELEEAGTRIPIIALKVFTL